MWSTLEHVSVIITKKLSYIIRIIYLTCCIIKKKVYVIIPTWEIVET